MIDETSVRSVLRSYEWSADLYVHDHNFSDYSEYRDHRYFKSQPCALWTGYESDIRACTATENNVLERQKELTPRAK